MPNGIDLILEDHRRVEGLFATFADTGDATVVGEIVDALTAHDGAEHAALYPLAGSMFGDEELLTRLTLAHSAVKRQIEQIQFLEGPALVEAVADLANMVREHVEDEETNVLTPLADVASADELDALGARILQAKQRVG